MRKLVQQRKLASSACELEVKCRLFGVKEQKECANGAYYTFHLYPEFNEFLLTLSTSLL